VEATSESGAVVAGRACISDEKLSLLGLLTKVCQMFFLVEPGPFVGFWHASVHTCVNNQEVLLQRVLVNFSQDF
jgi:hypothetical protein